MTTGTDKAIREVFRKFAKRSWEILRAAEIFLVAMATIVKNRDAKAIQLSLEPAPKPPDRQGKGVGEHG